MKFQRFAQYLSLLEKTSKRLDITDILSKLIKELDEKETDIAIYLSLGQLGPLFAQIDFAIAEKMMIRILCLAYETKEEEIKRIYEKEGDLGNVAELLSAGLLSREHKTIHKGVSITKVFETLKEIANISGTGSQDKKVSEFSRLLKDLDPLSARFVVRIPIGNTRLGFSEITIIEALSWVAKGDKSLKTDIESYFHIYPDIGLIAKLFKMGGLRGLKNVQLEVGVPVLPQLCQRVATAEEAIEKLGGASGAEYKYDGTRVQLHLDRNKTSQMSSSDQLTFFSNEKGLPFAKTFTRNLEETTHMFPDLIKAAFKQVDAQNAIIDGEAVGMDPRSGKLIPFQETSQRKRKHNVAEKISEIPLRYFVFDLLYLNGKSLINLPMSERRKILQEVVKPGVTIVVDDQKIVSDSKELLDLFKKAKSKGLEGLVIKKLADPYEAGGRGYSWVKFKREETGDLSDTIDGVILGYYSGRGHRAQFGIGGFLVGLYDRKKDGFVTVCKVGSGPTEEEWMEIKRRVDKIKSKEIPSNYEVGKTLLCDVWAKPEIMVVIRADEISVSDVHTAGFALRFPRLMQFRSDKRPEDSTTVEEIKHLYKLQGKKLS